MNINLPLVHDKDDNDITGYNVQFEYGLSGGVNYFLWAYYDFLGRMLTCGGVNDFLGAYFDFWGRK